MKYILKVSKIIFVSLLLIISVVQITYGQSNITLEERIDKLAESYVNKPANAGVVIGVIQPAKEYFKGYGVMNKKTNETPDSATIFEIGSISKVFTTAIFAHMAEAGVVNYDDFIDQYLPAVKLSPDVQQKITLKHLASHTSGLPSLPEEWLNEMDTCNPYKDLTVEMLYGYLSTAKLQNKPGEKSVYSNLGMGLLGHIIELKQQKSYDELVKHEICTMLGMTNTTVNLTESQRKFLATGHSETGNQTCNWDIPVLSGAGALKSNMVDMVKFLRGNLYLRDDSLYQAFSKCHQPVADAEHFLKVGLGWHMLSIKGENIIWHNGGTGGYRSFIGFNKEKQTGIIVLSNAANSVDELGIMALLSALNTP